MCLAVFAACCLHDPLADGLQEITHSGKSAVRTTHDKGHRVVCVCELLTVMMQNVHNACNECKVSTLVWINLNTLYCKQISPQPQRIVEGLQFLTLKQRRPVGGVADIGC